MSKPKIMRKSLNCQLNGTVWAMLNDYCEESGLSKTVATEQAIKMYIKSKRDDLEALKRIKEGISNKT